MFTSYLRDDFITTDQAQFEKDLGYVENAADKMGVLLGEILQLSRIGRKEESKTEVRLEKIVKEAVDLVAGSISKRGVKLIYSAPPVILYGYAQRFQQLYQNLIDNAVKFMGDQPSPEIEIGTYIDENRNNEIVLFVKDNGVGIDPQLQPKLFGLFEKLDPKSEGTGIGLALVKRIVEVHSGNIWVSSKGYGEGTTFYFTLEKTRIKD
jgi:signal transduction histidine kinase